MTRPRRRRDSHGGQNVGQQANPHAAKARFDTHEEPAAHAGLFPHLQTDVAALVSHHSFAPQQVPPHFGPSAHPPLGAHDGAPASVAAPPVEEPPPEEAPPVDAPPVDVTPPADGAPPAVEVPPLDDVPPTELAPPLDDVPPRELAPPFDDAPPGELAPPFDDAPPGEFAPPFDDVPPTELAPPLDDVPPTALASPPIEFAPPFVTTFPWEVSVVLELQAEVAVPKATARASGTELMRMRTLAFCAERARGESLHERSDHLRT